MGLHDAAPQTRLRARRALRWWARVTMTGNKYSTAARMACIPLALVVSSCGERDEVISNELMAEMYPETFRPGDPPYSGGISKPGRISSVTKSRPRISGTFAPSRRSTGGDRPAADSAQKNRQWGGAGRGGDAWVMTRASPLYSDRRCNVRRWVSGFKTMFAWPPGLIAGRFLFSGGGEWGRGKKAKIGRETV